MSFEPHQKTIRVDRAEKRQEDRETANNTGQQHPRQEDRRAFNVQGLALMKSSPASHWGGTGWKDHGQGEH